MKDYIIGRHYIQRIEHPKNLGFGNCTFTIESRDVVLLAISGKYAMVRRKGCIPYVCSVNELSLIPTVAEMRKLIS